jgi:hypothetical protein
MPAIHSVDITARRNDMPVNQPDQPGPLWVEVRPGLHRMHTLAGDILAALGKNRDIAGKGRNEHQDIAHAIAWLRAHNISDLVVVDAQRLHPKILGSLSRLAASAEVELWLLHRPPRTDAFVLSLSRRGPDIAEIDDVPRPTPRAPMSPTPSAALPAVPADEFVSFRAAYQRALDDEQAARVEQRFLTTARHCHKRFAADGATEKTVATLVHHIVNPAPDDPELVVDLRALQVAAWDHNLYVKIDMPRLLNSEERPRIPTARADGGLAAYRQPYRAIACSLGRLGHGVADIADITIGDTRPDGRRLSCNGHEVELGDAAARAVRAQLHLRARSGATEDDPLLPQTPKALAKALTDAAIDVGVRVHGRRAERTRDHTQGALRALGITIADLT